MTRIIHTADTHIGYAQYHRSEREKDFADAFKRVIDAAVSGEHGDIDAVVHAGDLFHDPSQPPTVLATLKEQIERLADSGIPFLAVVGNHDATQRGTWLELYDNAIHLDTDPTVVGDVAFYGVDYTSPSYRSQMDYDFVPTDDADSAALVSHGRFSELTPGDWRLTDIIGGADVGFDVALLGDEHTPIVDEVAGIPATYPGSTERTATDQRMERGYNVVDFDGDEVSISRATIETRPFLRVTADANGSTPASEIRSAIDSMDVDGAVVEIVIEDGEGNITLSTLEEYAEDKGALVAIARDRREHESGRAGEIDIQLEDPDEYVGERVEALGLPPAVSDVDDRIREGDVAKSNMDDVVADDLSEAAADGDEQFEPADDVSNDVAGGDAEQDNAEDGADDPTTSVTVAEAGEDSVDKDPNPGVEESAGDTDSSSDPGNADESSGEDEDVNEESYQSTKLGDF